MSFWGKLGKIALKAAPIAAGFIPGVGPLASMAIGGLASGASKKLEGGSWKDALISGGIGAGTGYGSAKLAQGLSAKGIGPSKIPGVAGKGVTGTDTSYIGKAVGDVAKKSLGAGGVPWGKIGAGVLAGGVGGALLKKAVNKGGNYDVGPEGRGGMDQYGGPRMGQGEMNYRTPNLAYFLQRGQDQAIEDQPWRSKDFDRTQKYDIGPTRPRRRQEEYASMGY